MEAVFAPAGASVWRAQGPRALPFLNDVLAQDLSGLTPGQGALAALLTDKGRIRAVLRVLADDGGARLLGDPLAAGGVADGIARVAPLAGVDVTDETERWRLVRVLGDAGRAIGTDVPSDEHAWVTVAGAIVIRAQWGGAGADLLVPAGELDAWLGRLQSGGARAVGLDAIEAARIAGGRPVVGVDVGEDTLVNETPLLEHAVSPAKGCYPGQESVARVRTLGRVRRRLAILHVTGPPPHPGSPVVRAGVAVGRVTSAAPADEGAVALALVRADVSPGEAVEVGSAPATVAG